MRDQEIVKLMKDLPFFKPFSVKEMKTIANLDSHIVEYKKGGFVIRQGEKDSTIFILLKGSLAITKDEVPDAELNTLQAGAMFGEVPLITGKTRSTNVIAKNKVVALKMDGLLLKTLDPSILNKFKDHLIKVLIKRLDEMNSSMAAFKFEFEKMYRRL
ncbi:MAG: cyclic nucleotide-binding domain-containing protein [Nitrospina sp.]|nr:cyclic nucleotide-binding domain-containing protein [Nitrospina sp.]